MTWHEQVTGIRQVPVVTQTLRRLLVMVLLLFALLSINASYLGAVTLLEHLQDTSHQDAFYLVMFLAHLVLGLLVTLPFLAFGLLHLRRAIRRPNRYAVRAGIALFTTGVVIVLSGLVLTRFGFLEINDADTRELAYWLHVVTPFVAVWLFVLHRLGGRNLEWRAGIGWGVAVVGVSAIVVGAKLFTVTGHAADPLPAFATTLIRTPDGGPIAAEDLMTDAFCADCHADVAAGWRDSAHRLSSFNNPFYRFSVDETRHAALAQAGSVGKAQFCAGCHDVVPLLSGAFDDPAFDADRDPGAHAGLTCTSCHAITRVNGVLGNADFSIAPPVRYPFERSDNPLLAAVARQLIRAKPSYHKQGFLKPLHGSTEFCGACHKAHVPPEVNDYRWLRAQNHYDSFLLSGVSGHRVDSFYYPEKATANCQACHMPLQVSDDPAARDRDGSGERKVRSHRFPAANTGVAHALGLPDRVNDVHRAMLEGSARVDIFALRDGGEIDGPLHAPLDRSVALLEPGGRYLLQVVVRTLRVGHHLTQGTADSNELWLDVSVHAGGRLIGRSGALRDDGRTDPWSYFVNSYVLTRDGERLDRRNGQDAFVTLYNHQIPPGAAATVNYRLVIPDDVSGPVTVSAALRYRKFDTTYVAYVQGDDFVANDLPVTTLGEDTVTLQTRPGEVAGDTRSTHDAIPMWERWNDYGIGLLLAGETRRTALRQAADAFARVEALGRGDGPLNLARVYLAEGRVDDAAEALRRAAATHPEFRPWTRAWLTARVDREHGHLERAIATLDALLATRFTEARDRGFDFSRDYRARNLLARTLYERARQLRGVAHADRRRELLVRARTEFGRVLAENPEDLSAHANLALVSAELGDAPRAQAHRALAARYRPDDHAVERAVTAHRRRNPAADHAAEAGAIYDLQREGAYGLPPPSRVADGDDDQATEIPGAQGS